MGSGLVPENARSEVVGAYNSPCAKFLRSSVLRTSINLSLSRSLIVWFLVVWSLRFSGQRAWDMKRVTLSIGRRMLILFSHSDILLPDSRAERKSVSFGEIVKHFDTGLREERCKGRDWVKLFPSLQLVAFSTLVLYILASSIPLALAIAFSKKRSYAT